MVRSGYGRFRQSKLGQLQSNRGQHFNRKDPRPRATGGLHASGKPNAYCNGNGYTNSNSYRNRYTNCDVDPNAGDANTSASSGSGIEYFDPIAG